MISLEKTDENSTNYKLCYNFLLLNSPAIRNLGQKIAHTANQKTRVILKTFNFLIWKLLKIFKNIRAVTGFLLVSWLKEKL